MLAFGADNAFCAWQAPSRDAEQTSKGSRRRAEATPVGGGQHGVHD
jgi:hypothetical protein